MPDGFVYPVPVGSGGGGLADGTYGDIVVSGGGTLLDIGAGAVGNAELRDSFGLSVIGRALNSLGNPADIVASGGDNVLRVNTAGTLLDFGVVATGGLANNAVTNAKIRQSVSKSVVGNDTSITDDVRDIVGAAASQVLQVNGSNNGLVWATVPTAGIANDAVTYAKIQNVSATDKLLGRSTAGAGDVEEIACTAAGRALIDDAAASNQRTTLGLGSLATQSFAAWSAQYTHFFDRPCFTSVGGAALAVANPTLDDSTDDDGHTIGVLMNNLVETWVAFSCDLPSGVSVGAALSVDILFRLQVASSGGGDEVDFDILARSISDGDTTTGGNASSNSETCNVDASAAGGGSGRLIIFQTGGGGGWLTHNGGHVKGVIKRDATIGNASDTYEQAIRLVALRFYAPGNAT